ncbi:hypothetical protein BRADI_2g20820v3 [Brachypodium distachyon]|uniref:Peroxidase n=1 Tax=Brachypodium distachyon TaxID=15368 RepID=A0A2K2D9N5_BRADI|nr:hypothetical protein BRADI_2g20820v3 [Brachypodium distachyon]
MSLLVSSPHCAKSTSQPQPFDLFCRSCSSVPCIYPTGSVHFHASRYSSLVVVLMSRKPRLLLVACLVLLIGAALPKGSRAEEPGGAAGLRFGFYNATCPAAEDVVFAEMHAILREDPTLAPSLLRMHYHDCFVQGCDGSIMLRSRSGTAERDATPNRSMRGYGAIERIKARLESVCPLTVSCADIIAMAARDAVYLSKGPWYAVETGRRDGNETLAEYAETDLAPPDSNIVDVKTFFSVKSLNSKDIAVLFALVSRQGATASGHRTARRSRSGCTTSAPTRSRTRRWTPSTRPSSRSSARAALCTPTAAGRPRCPWTPAAASPSA